MNLKFGSIMNNFGSRNKKKSLIDLPICNIILLGVFSALTQCEDNFNVFKFTETVKVTENIVAKNSKKLNENL